MTDPTKTEGAPVAAPHADAHAHGDEHDHVMPLWLLTAVIVILLILTVVTVGVAMVTPNLILAMAIATVKASLVCAIFMHLYWDKPFNTVILLISIGLLGLFLWFAILDTGQYQQSVNDQFTDEGMTKLRAAENPAPQ
jgi:cytochrome c oxidase subunit 4